MAFASNINQKKYEISDNVIKRMPLFRILLLLQLTSVYSTDRYNILPF